MIYQNIGFHNVEELIRTEKGLLMCRLPHDVREGMNSGVREKTSFYGTGAELRFKIRGDKATIILRADEAAEAQVAYIFYGSIQGGWENSSRVILTENTRITVARPDNMDRLKELTAQNHLPFLPEVVRVVLPYVPCYFIGAEGDIEAPDTTDLPDKTYLAYGSSITHGSLALAAPYTYPFRIAQKLGCDYLNLGFAGSAHAEKEMAEYLISRKDWDFASMELGINMIGKDFSVEFFEERVKNFTEVLASDPRKIFITSVFGFNGEGQEKAARYREIVKRYAGERFVHTDGLELLNDPRYISQDLTHPTLEGMEKIADRWAKIMKREMNN